MTLEELAKWHDELGRAAASCYLATAAALRELQRRRTQPIIVEEDEREATNRLMTEAEKAMK